eukprot:CAMPEP_0194334026 /NCGR_PEP_ID=MMETSP0171-20130528/64744_1 /TAXON_ID=218684 /ORGANISM="Corethron pennatum, Strain L29A3" /LENGTH=44 /DNA_ID= /DNA_START= /DNA_END= /DNA_ORIENTATION=
MTHPTRATVGRGCCAVSPIFMCDRQVLRDFGVKKCRQGGEEGGE